MSYWDDLISSIAVNLGFTFPDLWLLITTLSCLIFFSKDIKLGLIMIFLISACNFTIFYILGWSTARIILILFLALIFLAFSIYLSSSKTVIN